MLIFVKSSSAIVPTSEFYVDPNGPTDNQPGIGCGVVHSPTLPMTITNLRGIPSESIPVDRLYVSNSCMQIFSKNNIFVIASNCKYMPHIMCISYYAWPCWWHELLCFTLIRFAVDLHFIVQICDPLYKNLTYVTKKISLILIRADRARHKLSFDIYDIIVWPCTECNRHKHARLVMTLSRNDRLKSNLHFASIPCY